MKHLIYTTTAAFALSFTACGKKDIEVLPTNTVGLRITSEVQTELTAERITVIPNDIAPWLSQILLLSEGRLHRTTATGGSAQAVNAGDIKDVVGLMRKGEAGTALTLNRDGNLTALIEKDDDGYLGRLNVSAKASNYDGFCQHKHAPEKLVTAYSGNSLVTLNISYSGSNLMTVSEVERTALSKPVTSCYVEDENIYAISGAQLFRNSKSIDSISGKAHSLTGLSLKGHSATLLYTDNANSLSSLAQNSPKMLRNIVIQDGLSTSGTKSLRNIFVTEDSLGGTFPQGALIAQDADADRIILVSAPFARRVLATDKKR